MVEKGFLITIPVPPPHQVTSSHHSSSYLVYALLVVRGSALIGVQGGHTCLRLGLPAKFRFLHAALVNRK